MHYDLDALAGIALKSDVFSLKGRRFVIAEIPTLLRAECQRIEGADIPQWRGIIERWLALTNSDLPRFTDSEIISIVPLFAKKLCE